MENLLQKFKATPGNPTVISVLRRIEKHLKKLAEQGCNNISSVHGDVYVDAPDATARLIRIAAQVCSYQHNPRSADAVLGEIVAILSAS